MQACYPVTRRGTQIVWSGSPLHGVAQFKDAIEGKAANRAAAALAKGYPGMKRTDIPGFTWLEQESDALFRNNAHQVTAGEAALWRDQQRDAAANAPVEAEVAA